MSVLQTNTVYQEIDIFFQQDPCFYLTMYTLVDILYLLVDTDYKTRGFKNHVYTDH
jgi:hypothetical protein